MKPTLRTSAALLTLSLALTAGAVSAAPLTSPSAANAVQGIASSAANLYSITINGSNLTDTGFQPSAAKEPLIPLRAVASALGFDITWNPAAKAVDLHKGNIYTTVKSGEDRYVINKMYTTLGTAPLTKADKIYVPASFVSEVLHQTVVVEGKKITINSAVEHVNEQGVITSIHSSDGYASVQIKGAGTAGLVLNISRDTVIEQTDGTSLAFADLQLGMTVSAEHAMFATFSLPPQTPAYRITVQDDKLQSDVLGTAGNLEELTRNGDGSLSIRVKGSALSEASQSEIVLRLAADTPLVNESGGTVEPSALVEGASVIGFYTPVMTRSLPPIAAALKVVVQTPQPVQP
ncbi:copper amine oxidase N-terminal domain-containing protein [Paenibacillus sp. MMS20-IR301]|uniref:copper amine oxidase N-terminal domain-containing protein n=1 Tax=Paenibacillus sp. MMS20-IR301 TaxID=2895946 RepID=UPI0028E39F7A|nr:copper amine oxidase N-terminal domain-containing protein [Paenibacillus sp. MMS20-IR301]WNS42456.1 copper amine oxidase N-terminal domain-containing protein [Paenibacillus sp. MMS20-IR301]